MAEDGNLFASFHDFLRVWVAWLFSMDFQVFGSLRLDFPSSSVCILAALACFFGRSSFYSSVHFLYSSSLPTLSTFRLAVPPNFIFFNSSWPSFTLTHPTSSSFIPHRPLPSPYNLHQALSCPLNPFSNRFPSSLISPSSRGFGFNRILLISTVQPCIDVAAQSQSHYSVFTSTAISTYECWQFPTKLSPIKIIFISAFPNKSDKV